MVRTNMVTDMRSDHAAAAGARVKRVISPCMEANLVANDRGRKSRRSVVNNTEDIARAIRTKAPRRSWESELPRSVKIKIAPTEKIDATIDTSMF